MACSHYYTRSSLEMVHSKGNEGSRRRLVNEFDWNLQRNESIGSKLSKLVGVVTRIVSNDDTFGGDLRAFALNVLGESLRSLNHCQAVHVGEARSHTAPQACGAKFNS